VESLKKELAYFVNRPDEVSALGKSAKERVQENYSWEAIASRTLEVYGDTLHGYQHSKEHYASYRSK